MTRSLQVVALLVAPLALATAQKTIVGMSGTVMRYHGDTIWMERDSTLMRSITRGDTVDQITSINGTQMHTERFLVKGGSAWRLRESPGGLPPVAGEPVPLAVATMMNQMLAMEARGAEAMSRLAALPMFSDKEASLGLPKSYTVEPDLHLTRSRDTVLYIRGCLDSHPDTTVFLLFGTDSVRRLTTPQRTFGQGMAESLVAKMRLATMQEFAASAMTLPPDLPKAPGSCSK